MTWHQGVGLNLVGAMPADRGPLSDRMLAAALEHDPVLIEAVEADDLRRLNRRHWQVRHRSARNLDGVLLAVRKDVLRLSPGRWRRGAPASPVNAPRPILTAQVREVGALRRDAARIGVYHRPKRGGEKAGAIMDERARRAKLDQSYADHNLGVRDVRAAWPRHSVVGVEVVFLTSTGGRVRNVRAVDLLPRTEADDHPALFFELRL